jgi:hypothetical protein
VIPRSSWVWISALTILLSVTEIRFAQAASCCGGASATNAFTLPKFQQAMAGSAVQIERSTDLRDASGERLHTRDWVSTDSKLVVGGAYRLGREFQASASLPFVRRDIRAGSQAEYGLGVGDAGVQLRYEMLDEETCFARPIEELTWFDLKPSIHWVLQGTLPTGRPVSKSAMPLGADVTGRGVAGADGGIEITKVWGRWGNSLFANAGYQKGWDDVAPTGSRWAAGAGVMYFFAYRNSLSINASYREEGGTVDIASTQTGLQWSYQKDSWWARINFGESGFWQGRSTPVTFLAAAHLSTLWMP